MKLKEMLVEWLTESRYCRFIEAQLIQQRQDFTAHLAEKDDQIRSLRIEIASLKMESDRMRLILMPLGSPAGAAYAASFIQRQDRPPADKPAFEPMDDWQSELQRAIREDEKHGIYGERREEVHQSATDDAA